MAGPQSPPQSRRTAPAAPEPGRCTDHPGEPLPQGERCTDHPEAEPPEQERCTGRPGEQQNGRDGRDGRDGRGDRGDCGLVWPGGRRETGKLQVNLAVPARIPAEKPNTTTNSYLSST